MAGKTDAKGYEDILRAAGVRVTRPRRAILQIIETCEDHPDATEIYRRALKLDKSISLATVYRTMKVLEDKGAIHRHVFDNGPARFENAQHEHHDHMVDLDSGELIEFHSDRIEALQEEIAARLGYRIERHHLVLYGRKLSRP